MWMCIKIQLDGLIWIVDIMVWIWGSVSLTYRYHTNPVPDPTLFVSGFQDASKKELFFSKFCCLLLLYTEL
jgi:hypothetical protein